MTYAGKTSDKGVKLHSVKGKTVQQTTNGYQLFDSSKLPGKSASGASITNNGDGSFTFFADGSSVRFTDSEYKLTHEEFVKLFKVGNVYLKGSYNNVIYFELAILSSSGNLYLRNNEIKEITDEIYSDATAKFYFAIPSGANASKTTIKPMFYQDGDGTWEPYTGGKPAPNPDYPMEIENVEISKVFSSSGNMLNLNWDWEHNNVDYMITNDRTIKAFVTNKIGYPMLSHVFSDNELEFIKGKYITPLYDKKESSKTTSIFQIYFKNPNGSYYISPFNSKQFIPKNITQFVVQLVIVNSDNLDGIEVGDYATFTAPRIIVGDLDDTSWRPYGFNAIETSLTLAEGDTYENGQVTNNFVNENLGNLFNVIQVSGDQSWYNPELSYSYELKGPKVKLKLNALGKCTHFQSYDFESFYNKSVETGIMNNQSYCVVNISKSLGICTTVEEFKAWIQEQDVRVLKGLETPTAEELKIPTIPSYFLYTEVSTDNELETDITWKVLADCDNSLKQEELEQRILALETKAIE